MKGASRSIKTAVAREDAHIEAIDKRHIYCRHDHRHVVVGRRVFIRVAAMSRAQDDNKVA